MRGWGFGVLGVLAGVLAVPRVAAADPQGATRRAGQADEERARAIETQLRSDPQLEDDKVSAEVTGRRVRLVGSVDSVAERQRAELLVKKMDPTLIIENQLEAERDPKRAPDRAPADAASSDDGISSRLRAQLGADGSIESSGVQVETDEGVVWLKGEAQSEADRKRIIAMARATRGVLLVVDQMTVDGGPPGGVAPPLPTPR